MPPTPALTDPAAVLPGEAELLAAVLADLAGETPKLVYADWLDDHADPARAAHLRAVAAALRTGGPLPPAGKLAKGWRELIGAGLVAAARKHGFADRVGVFLKVARPGFDIVTTKTADDKLPVGASKFGGTPDLPDDTDWPADEADDPLAFLGQINLGELAGSPAARELPAAGLLSLFYSGEGYAEEADGWRVFHFPDPAAVSRRDLPTELPDDARYAACRLTFAEVLAVPALESPWEKEVGRGMDDAAQERYDDGVFGRRRRDRHRPLLGHLLLGHPAPIQSDPLGRKTVRHLLTIDSDDHPGWMWGDMGALYFTITAKDLKAGRLDRARCEMQCG